MTTSSNYQGGENFNLRTALKLGRSSRLARRAAHFSEMMGQMADAGELLTRRQLSSPTGREVTVRSDGADRRMLMFGSNDYLGLAEHPAVVEAVCRAAREHGVGVGGPPLLNGTTVLHTELEERLAELKSARRAMLFASGYAANVGLVSGLAGPEDFVIYDAYSHASFADGIRLSGAKSAPFRHNDLGALTRRLEAATGRDVFVGVEGVYSMDGDRAPLGDVVELCRRFGALLLLDDAHGTGAIGATGRGSAEAAGVEGMVDLTMGTFSKTFGVIGGFVAGDTDVIEYLRYFARSHMFSASLPPVVVAAVLAGLRVLEEETWRVERLRANTERAVRGLAAIGIDLPGTTQILPLRVPDDMDIRRASRRFHDAGIFLNSIEYPAVPMHEQRFRVSIMATHTDADIDRLVEVIEQVWRAERTASRAAA